MKRSTLSAVLGAALLIVFAGHDSRGQARSAANGVVSPSVTVRYKEALEGLKRQEQTLTERELQVTSQLETERENLADLYKRLDALEREMVTSQRDDKPKR